MTRSVSHPAGREFPVIEAAGAATPASTLKWFVTAHSVETRLVEGVSTQWPSSTAHAKRMGMTVTACGIPATSWPKLYALPYPVQPADNCVRCSSVLSAESPGLT